MDTEVVKITKFNTLKAKANDSEKKISEATALIHINQYNTDNKIYRKNGDVNKKYQTLVV